MRPIGPICPISPIRPPSDKQRPRCGKCGRPLVVMEDLTVDLDDSEVRWISSWSETPKGADTIRCRCCAINWDIQHGYVAEPYAHWCEQKLAEENRLLNEWNKGPGAPGAHQLKERKPW